MKMQWRKDLCNALLLHVRLLLKKYSTWLLLCISFLILGTMLLYMEDAKDEKSRIAIGICDKDQSEMSKMITGELAKLELYLATEGTEQELTTLLREGKLSAVCVIKKGFETSVLEGKTDKLIALYETENGGALLLPDILAGVMMRDVCVAKSYELLREYMKKTGREFTLTREEYREYLAKTMKESGVAFTFDVTYLMPESGEEQSAPLQSLIYQQAVFAVFALLAGMVSIYSVLPFWDVCHGKINSRVKTLPVKRSAWYAGSCLGAVFVPGIFSLMFGIGLFLKNPDTNMKFGSFLVCTMTYLCVIVIIMLVAAAGIKSSMVYQMGMLAMMLVFGIFGLVSMIDGLFLPEGISGWVPNGWYVKKMTELFAG